MVHRIGKVAYRLDSPSELRGIHNLFHVSQLWRYLADSDHVVNDEPTKMTPDLSYIKRPIQIWECEEK
jgi:hypothetical protein